MRTLDELLDEVTVFDPEQWQNELSAHTLIKNWFAVANADGIIAYFGTEADALRFRLDYINGLLNPIVGLADQRPETDPEASVAKIAIENPSRGTFKPAELSLDKQPQWQARKAAINELLDGLSANSALNMFAELCADRSLDVRDAWSKAADAIHDIDDIPREVEQE